MGFGFFPLIFVLIFLEFGAEYHITRCRPDGICKIITIILNKDILSSFVKLFF